MSSHSHSVSRRRFLQGASASLAVPLIVSSRALGDDTKAAANERINIGLIGIGKMMFGSHLPHFVKMPELQVVAVCDVDRTRRDAGKQRVDEANGNGDCQSYVDYRELLARDDIDAVAIATPDHWHGTIIMDACKAGKHIYCEKPLCNTIMECQAVVEAVNASKIVFQTGSQQRSDDNFRYACELVRNGHIGKLQEVRVNVGGPPKPCDLAGEEMEPGLDWDRWLGPAPMRDYSSVLSPRGMHDHFPAWRNYSEYGGGGMTDWGAHHFDIAQWGLGMDKSGPVEVIPPEYPKSGHGVRFRYANGVEVIHGGTFGVEFVGEDGEVRVNRGKLESTPGEIIQTPIGDDEIHLYKSPGGGHGGHRQDWVNCIKTREQPNCPIETGARTAAVCHLGNLAYRHGEELGGKSLKWDPQAWQFVDNDTANGWLEYTYGRREGYAFPSA
ncbi:MAG: Gfo/Idh/MocA family oxidoreductase [Planctomycetaceae bacterium]|nr:Gfo/Idh/MocA family oxidoreductase [Planctomycetaceae bacterium]